MDTYYSILGVTQKATKAEIKSAYRALAVQYHPDRTPDANEAVRKLIADKMAEVNEAYAVLSKDSKRAQYDALIAQQFPQAQPQAAQPATQAQWGPNAIPTAGAKKLSIGAKILLATGAMVMISWMGSCLRDINKPASTPAAAAAVVASTPTPVVVSPVPTVVKPIAKPDTAPKPYASPDQVKSISDAYHLDYDLLILVIAHDKTISSLSDTTETAKYLRALLEYYDFDLVKALAAYETNADRVDEFQGVPPEARVAVAQIVHDYNQKKLAQQASKPTIVAVKCIMEHSCPSIYDRAQFSTERWRGRQIAQLRKGDVVTLLSHKIRAEDGKDIYEVQFHEWRGWVDADSLFDVPDEATK